MTKLIALALLIAIATPAVAHDEHNGHPHCHFDVDGTARCH
jgi:hypothetical protein